MLQKHIFYESSYLSSWNHQVYRDVVAKGNRIEAIVLRQYCDLVRGGKVLELGGNFFFIFYFFSC